MNKRRLIPAALWVTAISPLFFASCVDDSYDLSKDIDMTVTIGGNLSIPGSNIAEFTLDDIMDLEYHENPEDSVIRVDANGDYRLLQQESSDPTDVDIDPVNIDEPESEATRTELNFDTPATTGNELETEVEDVTMHFTFTKDDVTTDIVSMSSSEVTGLEANLTLSFDPESYNVSQITLKQGFTIEMQMEGQTTPDNIVFECLEPENYRILPDRPQTIEFLSDQTIPEGEILRIPVRISRIQNFPEGQGLYEPGHFKMQTNVIAKGTATTPNTGAGDTRVVLINDAEVPSFTLAQVTGVFDPDVDITVDPVTVNDIPDFLDDESNTLDIKNPYIKLSISNETPIDVNLTADIIRMRNGMQDAAPISIGSTEAGKDSIILYAGAEDLPTISTYYLSREAMPEIEDEASKTYNIVMGDDIYNLIRTIPDEIRLENIEAKALDNEYTVALGEDGAHYVVNTDYEINAALQFGEELLITYKDTINDWNGDLEDITIKKAVVEMDAINGIPLNFTVNATAIDVDGHVYDNVTVTPVHGNIAAGLCIKDANDNYTVSTPTDSEVVLEITCEDGMENLDGLIINFEADAKGLTEEQRNATLNKGMTLRLENIRIRIEGGVTVDMN